MIHYIETADRIEPHQLTGFFVGWPNPPSPDTHFRLLHNSQFVVLALDTTSGNVVGFITAVSDGVLAAYIPFLEVLPEYQSRGIGSELVQRMLTKLEHLYMIDLLCDVPLQSFYKRFAMRPAGGMLIRNYKNQAGDHQ